MRHLVELDGTWQVAFTEGLHGAPEQVRLWEVDEGRYTATIVPHEVHCSLQESGVLPDLNLGLHSLAARWVEEQWWLYRRWFDLEEADLGKPAWLVFAGLDYQAIIYLNGEEVGRHANAHLPCRIEVTGKLRAGRNLLALALESGLDYVTDRAGADYTPSLSTTRRSAIGCGRHSMRRVGTGIHGCSTSASPAPSIWRSPMSRGLPQSPYSQRFQPISHARRLRHARGSTTWGSARDSTVHLRVVESGDQTSVPATIAPGETLVTATVEMVGPALWWPRGHGPQTLYTVEVTLDLGRTPHTRQVRRTGIRRARINQDPHPVMGRFCVIEVNGREITCNAHRMDRGPVRLSRCTS